MAKGFTARAKTYLVNLTRYVRRLSRGNASLREVIIGIARDTRKLGHRAAAGSDNTDHNESVKLTELGRRAYNQKDYVAAANLFKRANLADPLNALALTYLGHTAYKQANAPAAVDYWKRAVVVDPLSPAADKARRQLVRGERLAQKTIEELENRLKEG